MAAALLRSWAGPDYGDSFLIGLLLILAIFVPLFQNVGLEIQKAQNKHKVRSILFFLIALANIAMTIPFSKWWGGTGAALATFICMFAGNTLFMNWYYAKHIHLDIFGFWKSILRILPGYILPILTGAAVHSWWHLRSYWDILLAAFLIGAIFCISIWLFSMNDYEKDLIRKPVKKLLRH